jgi:hypothetical protein
MNPPFTNLEEMVSYYRWLAAAQVWKMDFPDRVHQ